MRAVHVIRPLLALLLGSCSRIQPVDTAVKLHEGATVDVPFAITATGTYDIQLQYSGNVTSGLIEEQMQREFAGSATLRAGDKKLEWQLPTGWYRVSPFDNSAHGMVLRRFHAYANTPYVLTLHITQLPDGLQNIQGIVSVYQVSRLFHPGHQVYELQ